MLTSDRRGWARPDAKFVAGGTNLIDLMKMRVETPAHLVDVNHLPLADIENLDGGSLRVGALVRNSALAGDTRVRERYPVLSEALLAGASGQLRNRRNRRQPAAADPLLLLLQHSNALQQTRAGLRLLGASGTQPHSRNLGASPECIAVHPSDMAVALTALDARVETLSANGKTRQIPMTEFHKLPGEHPRGRDCAGAGRADHRSYVAAAAARWTGLPKGS